MITNCLARETILTGEVERKGIGWLDKRKPEVCHGLAFCT